MKPAQSSGHMNATTAVPDDAPLPLAHARRLIADAVEPIVDTESVALSAALGRVLASDLIAQVAVPAHDNAAMDGYAFSSGGPALRLRVVGQAWAGRPYVGAVASGECVRIMTGAMMPRGCDAVVAQEDATLRGDEVDLPAGVRPGQHRRRAGEDLERGGIAIARGRRLTPSDLGLAASIGAATISVVKRPRIAVFSTGRELRALDQTLDAGSVHDSNRYTLIAMLARLGIEAIDLGIVDDDRDALAATLEHACGDAVRADAIVTSGGVSSGDADYTREVLQKAGRVAFWKLAIKPGRPMAFGRVGPVAGRRGRSTLLFGLPGNPVAVMVVFHALVRGALFQLMGAQVEPIACLQLICATPLRKARGRTEFVRAVAFRADDGWHVRPTGAQGSGILRSMSEANCLLVLEHDRGDVAAGEIVEAWPFEGLT